MRRLFQGLWLISLVLLPLHSLPAQTPVPSSGQKDNSQEAAVLQRLITKTAFQEDGSGTRESTAQIKIQSAAGVQQLGVIRFPYAQQSESVEIGYVRVRKANGSVVETPPEDIQDMPSDVTRVAPVYSDLREKHVAVKGLDVGDVLEYSVHFQITKAEVPGQFWFEYNFVKDGVAQDEELEISVPRDKYVKVKSPRLAPQVQEDGAIRIYRWTTANLEHKAEPKKNPAELASAPAPDVQLTSFRSWEEVGRWYGGLQRDRVAATPEIQAKAAELTKGMAGDAAKIQAIYNYVSTHNRYVGLSFGIGRYQPHFAAEVLSNEYGDCKDKHTLLAALLKAAGHEAWPALIPSARQVDAEVPSPAQFDHMISVVVQGKNLTWLDTTPGVAPFGLLLPGLRDKQALVIPGSKPAELMKTPADPPFPFSIRFDALGKLDSSGTFTGHMKRSSRGDDEVAFRAAFRLVPRANWQELVQRITAASGFGGTVSNVVGSDPDDTEEAFRYSYDYTRKDYSGWTDRRITPPLPIFGIEVLAGEETKPSGSVFVGAPGEALYDAQVELPVETLKLPSDSSVKQDFAEYSSTYTKKGNTLMAERRLVIKQHEIAASHWDDYKKFAKAVSDDENQWIVLESERADAGDAATATTTAAEQLLQQARQAAQNRDLTTAEGSLQRLIALDSRYPGAWSTMGIVRFLQNRGDEGVEDFQKEIANHPDDLPSYRILALAEMQMKRRADAIQTWRSLLKEAPDDRDAINNLGPLLLADKRYGDVIELLEPRVGKMPEAQMWLGTAYLETGQKDKGAVVMEKIVDQDKDPETLNSAAYLLADAGVDLPRAQDWAVSAVDAVEKQSEKAQLASLTPEDLRNVNLLAAYWDTLGWVRFRKGDLAEAEKYLEASWALSQDATVADHLGQLYEREGKVKAATHAYELALGAGPEQADARQHLNALTAKNPGLLPPSPHLQLPGRPAVPVAAGAELSAMRTVKLPRLVTKTASAEFYVLLSSGPKVEEVKFISGAEDLRQAEKALAEAHFNMPFPDDRAKIVRRGILMCTEIPAECSFVLLLPNAVRSVN